MLQQILCQNNKISSYPEPWFMLPLVYLYKYPNINQGYNPSYANINFLEYLGNFHSGLETLQEKIKTLSLELYALSHVPEGSFFLDKTPRYYHIAKDLLALFPDAKFIFLIRNPLAVFASMLSYNFNGNIDAFLQAPDRWHDLYKAPKNISEIKKQRKTNAIFINYESFVAQPTPILEQLSELIGIEFNSVNYNLGKHFISSQRIDTKSVHLHDHPVDTYLNSWKKGIKTYRAKQEVLAYIETLGIDTVETLGYDYAAIINDIIAHHVRFSAKDIAKTKIKGMIARW